MAMDSIPGIISTVSHWVVEERKTHLFVSEQLKHMYPSTRGLSVRSVERFCSRHNIHSSSRLTDSAVDGIVAEAVMKVSSLMMPQKKLCLHKLNFSQVGPSYGRKTITGLLAADGVRIGKNESGDH